MACIAQPVFLQLAPRLKLSEQLSVRLARRQQHWCVKTAVKGWRHAVELNGAAARLVGGTRGQRMGAGMDGWREGTRVSVRERAHLALRSVPLLEAVQHDGDRGVVARCSVAGRPQAVDLPRQACCGPSYIAYSIA